MLVRMVFCVQSDDLVRFAIVQRINEHGKWHDVVEVDTCHDLDAHLHQYSRRTGRHVGEPDSPHPIEKAEDVGVAYDAVFDRVFNEWEERGEVASWLT